MQEVETETAWGFPRRLKAAVVELIGLGIVASGFVVVAFAPWYAKAGGIPTVLLGIDVIQFPTRRDHLRLWWRRRDGHDTEM